MKFLAREAGGEAPCAIRESKCEAPRTGRKFHDMPENIAKISPYTAFEFQFFVGSAGATALIQTGVRFTFHAHAQAAPAARGENLFSESSALKPRGYCNAFGMTEDMP